MDRAKRRLKNPDTTEPPVAEHALQQAAKGDPGSTGSGSTGLNFNQGAGLHWLSFSGPAG